MMTREEAINMIKGWVLADRDREALETILPELKENEDKRIRAQIIYAINQLHICDETKDKCIAWINKQVPPKWLYRLEYKDGTCGLWYNGEGKWCFEQGIGSVEGCKTKDLPMDHDERYKQGGRDWFSSCSRKEDLLHWYSLVDAEELIKKGFVFTRYLATEYHEYENETVFIKNSSLVREEIDIFELFGKIKPMFKVGDIIKNKKNGDTVKVEQILSDSYCYSGWDGAATIHSDFLISDQGNWELVEQKPIDNVEPKFKVGDWVMLDRPVLITKVEDMPYNTHQYWTSVGTWFGDATNAKLWTIQDAKDGDVLESGQVVFIFKVIYARQLNCHCSAYKDGSFIDVSYNLMVDQHFDKVHPATKEQRDFLFQKMKEVGYEWDAEKKELRKIEQIDEFI